MYRNPTPSEPVLLRPLRLPAILAIACCAAAVASTSLHSRQHDGATAGGPFQFTPLPASAACVPGGTGETPLLLPPGYVQTVVAREGDGGAGDQWDMNTLNETGPHAGRFLYRTHEQRTNAHVSVTDLQTGVTRVLAARADWNRLDGIVWTPAHTLLAAEEMRPARTPSLPDPEVPQAIAGLVYEIDPVSGAAAPRPAIGARAHEGLRFDPQGNLYGISETLRTYQTGPASARVTRHGGFIYRFVPDRRNDLSSGQLYALQVTVPTGDRTGEAIWIALDRAAVQVDSDAAAFAAGATGYDRPEDVEIATSTGNNHGGSHVMYVAVTDENRVLRVELREPGGRAEHTTAFVSEYVRQGVNAPVDFEAPDNLALDRNGNLYITEDAPDPVVKGNDIWVAVPSQGTQQEGAAAEQVVRFASLTDCGAEPSGVYFDKSGTHLFVNILHRGGNDASGVSLLPDLGMLVSEEKRQH